MKSTGLFGEFLRGFKASLLRALQLPKFRAAVGMVALGVAIILAASFISDDKIKMVAGILGMLISCGGFDQIGNYIQSQQKQQKTK